LTFYTIQSETGELSFHWCGVSVWDKWETGFSDADYNTKEWHQ